jgi:Rho GTPase-activating protein 1
MDTIGDPHLAAVLLKKYLRDLPEAVFPESLYQTIRRCPPPSDDSTDMSSVAYIRETLLPALAPCVYILLSHYLREYALPHLSSCAHRVYPFRSDARSVFACGVESNGRT